MNANPKFMAATAQVDEAAVQPLPKSHKIYVQGSRPDIRVPMREISQSDTPLYGAPGQVERNPSLAVYDTSGPYTDPTVRIDIRSGLEPLRPPGSPSAAIPKTSVGLARVSVSSAWPIPS